MVVSFTNHMNFHRKISIAIIIHIRIRIHFNLFALLIGGERKWDMAVTSRPYFELGHSLFASFTNHLLFYYDFIFRIYHLFDRIALIFGPFHFVSFGCWRCSKSLTRNHLAMTFCADKLGIKIYMPDLRIPFTKWSLTFIQFVFYGF